MSASKRRDKLYFPPKERINLNRTPFHPLGGTMKTCSLLTLVGLAISFALPAFAQQKDAVDPEVRQQIEAVNMKLFEASNKGDAAAAAAFYEQNAVQVWHWWESGH